MRYIGLPLLAAVCVIAVIACGSTDKEKVWKCVVADAAAAYSPELGCEADFTNLSSEPLDAAIPGARSVKTVMDTADSGKLYFQNSKTYQIHWNFVSKNLSGNGLPIVPELSTFNQTEYFSPDRRFILGAITYYEGPKVWVYEIAPYDTASAEMIATAFNKIKKSAFFGETLYFHPTSEAVAKTAKSLPSTIKIMTTDEIFAGIDYQPLKLGTSYGKLAFFTAADLETAYIDFRNIVVLDYVPNDISVCNGIITQQFQTPLAHINVLSENRGTPNMGLRGAFTNTDLRALEGKWVKYTVGAFEYSVTEVTQEEADAWWEEHKPSAVQIPELDLSVTELTNAEDVLDMTLPLLGAIQKAIPAFGGKASHYGALAQIKTLPVPKAFMVPVYYYHQFMVQNGFDKRIEEMLADPAFTGDSATRAAALAQLRTDMMAAPVDAEFEKMLVDKINKEYPGLRMRFRSSTNTEDLDGFTGAGLYTSVSGDPNDASRPVLDAVREVWSSVWYFRAFEERSYRSISQLNVGMAMLVHHTFIDESATGVALTANIFDTTGLEPGFYVNVQEGDTSVVLPDATVTTDQFIYQFDYPGQPIIFYAHSSLIPEGETVLTTAQTYQLGKALKLIHEYFKPAYGPTSADPDKFYAMDVEFKFEGDPAQLSIKQARPHPGRGE